MNLKMKICKYSLLVSCFAAASTFAQDVADSASLQQKQESFLEKIADIESNTLGFSINGTAKAGYVRSSVESDNLSDDSQTAEAQAYTEADLMFSIRPSKETMAKFGLRVHKDWNTAHREGNNPPLITWWSYDGLILNRHVDFNLGTMRVGYTPLTIYQPQADYIMEPEVLRDRRMDVMEEKFLDGSTNRLMQGLNATYHSYQLGFMDDLYVQGTLARLRNNAKKADQLFFDFDEADRYLAGARIGLKTHGFTVGFNDAYAFDHVASTRATLLLDNYPVYYERNNVLSANLGYESQNADHKGLSFGVNAEGAMSYWTSSIDELVGDTLKVMAFYSDSILLDDGSKRVRSYLFYKDSIAKVPAETHLADLKNKLGIHADAYVEYGASKWNVKGTVNGIYTDKGFQAEMAMSPVTLGLTSILNKDAMYGGSDETIGVLLGSVRSGALENLYMSFYETVPEAAYNMMVNNTSALTIDRVQMQSDTFELFNNYKYAQYYRNGYNYKTMERSELLSLAKSLDPATSMALPYGYATPNRKGGDLNLNFEWNDAIQVRVLGGYYKSEKLDGLGEDSLYFASGSSYMRYGAGALVKVGALVGLNRTIDITGSFEQTKEEDYLERTSTSITGGFNVDVYGPVALLAGAHMLKSEFGVPYAGLLKGMDELLVLGGPRVKLGQGAYATIQYGFMKNSIEAVSETVDITKNILMADVKVSF